jgi:hypothetical protein
VRSLFHHLRIFWRVESTIVQIRLRTMTRRSMLYAFAGLIALFGLAMLNVAVFFALEPHLGAMWAAFVVAGGDFVLALLAVLIAAAAGPGPELNTALELRAAAIEGLEAEFAALQESLGWFSQAARNPLNTALPALIIPLVTAIIRGLRKHKTESEEPQ